jgi:hypothetical protein
MIWITGDTAERIQRRGILGRHPPLLP